MGKRERWIAVYAHRDRLLRLARARVGDPHDAEDCVSEAMLRCVEFEALDEERLGQFLTTVTVRLCADVHRRNVRGDKLSRKLAGYASVEPGPEEAICDRAESAWLTGHLADLPARQREIVAARAEGLSCAAVAERLVVSYTAIESALARVRRSMRVTLESTLGVAAVRADRWLKVAAETVTAGALVVTAQGGGAVAAAAPAASFAPARVAVVRVAAPVGSRPVIGVVRVARHAAVARALAVPARVAAVTPPTVALAPGAGVRAGDLSANARTHKHHYTAVERWEQCVQYGVTVGRHTQCNYPPDDDQ